MVSVEKNQEHIQPTNYWLYPFSSHGKNIQIKTITLKLIKYFYCFKLFNLRIYVKQLYKEVDFVSCLNIIRK